MQLLTQFNYKIKYNISFQFHVNTFFEIELSQINVALTGRATQRQAPGGARRSRGQ